MVMDHQQDIKEWAKKTDATAAYAKEALPTLQKHLQTAQSLTSSTTGSGQNR
jgi:hypothetical protein